MAFWQREVPLPIALAHGRKALNLLPILKGKREELIEMLIKMLFVYCSLQQLKNKTGIV